MCYANPVFAGLSCAFSRERHPFLPVGHRIPVVTIIAASGTSRRWTGIGTGMISEEEYNRADERIRNRLKEAGLAYRPGLTLDLFSKAGPKLDELRDKEREQDKQSRDSRGEGDRRGPDSGSSRGKPKEKVKLNVALPAAYTAIDKDHDGQIGLYEWERAKFAEFRAIDRNGDGFLSPKELVAGPKTAAVASGPTALPSGPVAPNAPNTPPPVASPGRPSAATPAAPVVLRQRSSPQLRRTTRKPNKRNLF